MILIEFCTVHITIVAASIVVDSGDSPIESGEKIHPWNRDMFRLVRPSLEH